MKEDIYDTKLYQRAKQEKMST